jgi:mannose-6-phosphate isomerase
MPATRLTTKRVEKPWGRRTLWPGFADAQPGGDPVGEVWFEAPKSIDGGDPELLVKYLFTSEKLSVQVHPDNAYARAHGHERGKDEAWVVLSAEPHATIAIGTVDVMSKDELRAAALDGSIEGKLKWWPIRAGEVYYSPAGTIHAMGPGLTLIEVQQNVDLTYRLYDYGSGRELHIDDAVAVSDPVPYVAPHVAREIAPGRMLLAEGPAFVMERWSIVGSATIAEQHGRPIWLVPLTGNGTVDGAAIQPGEVWIVQGGAELNLDTGAELLVAYPGAEAIEMRR